MKFKVLLILISMQTSVFAAEICSPEGREALLKMGINEAKLIQYCKESGKSQSTPKTFDLASGKNDFAEIQEALTDGSAVGAKVQFNLSNGFKSAYCTSYGNTAGGKPALYCGIEPGNSHILVYSKNKQTRLELLKKREPNQKRTSTGTIIEKYSNDMPVIELD